MSYDTLAPFYEWLETLTFGRALQRARCAPLTTWEGADPENVLILGDGNGRFLEQALQRWPTSSFTCIDKSEGMLRLARKRTRDRRVQFVREDARKAVPEFAPESFDVLVSHFFLDGFNNSTLHAMAPKIESCLKHDGVWFVSEFAHRAWWHGLSLWGMYRFFHLTTGTEATALPDYEGVLRANGRVSRRLGTWRAGFVIADCWIRSASLLPPAAFPATPSC